MSSKCDDNPKRQMLLGMEIPAPAVAFVKQNKQALVAAAASVLGVALLYVTIMTPPSSYDYSLVVRNQQEVCPNRIRAGDVEDGGWWICDAQTTIPEKDCVIYSFGIRDNFSFDHFFANKGCQVHGFDPSPAGLQSQKEYEKVQRAHYHSYGLGVVDKDYGPGKVPFRWPGLDYLQEFNTLPWKLKSLPTIMKEIGNSKLTILKVDVEGAEWDSMKHIAKAGWDELYMELHFPPGGYNITRNKNNDMIVTRTPHKPAEPPRRESQPARNTPGTIDRIALLQEINAIADMFYWDDNHECTKTFAAACIEITLNEKRIPKT
ncbi:methyltransferase like 24 [Seminavis robusta]|uniref:Methyltransferase like 24 n=1 Tax=Seminavis robusta TaxID=568900 RepID=A0A9N8E5Q6_9STRA|nr:methyltransferase like 24 [Seminavis robusta]|eukprot:Sro691_g187710.1 methyltransferase like 24 (319) ;mRNA; r:893-1849